MSFVACLSLLLVAWGEDMEQVRELLLDSPGVERKVHVPENAVVWFCIFANYRESLLTLLICLICWCARARRRLWT